MYKRVLAVSVAAVIALLVAALPGRAAPVWSKSSVITYPEPGATLSGIVEIRGIATHVNFDFYQVRYAPGTSVVADTAWVDIVSLVPNPVDNGVLCTWDTTALPDGQYVLALAVWGVDDPENPHVHFVEGISVNNSSFVPSPEPTLEEEPAATVPAGPMPTLASVVQPPTSTPRPSPEAGVGVDLDASVLQNAFCTGGLVTVMLFLLWGLYSMAKASIRWYMHGPKPPRR